MRSIFLAVVLLVLLSPVQGRAEEAQPSVQPATQGATAASVETAGPSKDELLAINEKDVAFGSKDAPVTIVEYASMSCSHCAAFHNETFSELKTKYIDTGKVRFAFRDFPLDETALRAAMVDRCAAAKGPENFLKFQKAFFTTQENWAPKKNFLEVQANIAKLGGMTSQEFEACIADKDLEKQIMETKLQAVSTLEVRSTPTFFVNGVMHKGARNLEYFSSVIDGILSGNPPVAPAE